MKRIATTLAFTTLLSAGYATAGRLDIQPVLQLEGRVFFEEPQLEEQLDHVQGGLVLTGDLRWVSTNRDTRIQFEPYLRLDTEDEERRYVDIREATVSYQRGDWDVLAGIGQVFWGVAESRNVVDVINQFDTVEDFDQGEKLGQPLIRISRRGDFGTLEAYYLPLFREQRFVGESARLRFDASIDDDAAQFERGGEEWAGDVALRYSNSLGAFDLGLHGFYGTSRDPLLVRADSGQALVPLYQKRIQGGLDLQYTEGPWLLKLESAVVDQGGDDFVASVAGFEYTFFDVDGRGFDIGLIAEYLYDDRDLSLTPTSLFDNDLFIGSRVTLNNITDTAFLAGAIVDTDTQALIGAVEFERRIGSNMQLEFEGRLFDEGDDPQVEAFKNDSHITLRLTRYL